MSEWVSERERGGGGRGGRGGGGGAAHPPPPPKTKPHLHTPPGWRRHPATGAALYISIVFDHYCDSAGRALGIASRGANAFLKYPGFDHSCEEASAK